MASPYQQVVVGGRAIATLRGRGPGRGGGPPLLLVHGAGGSARNFFSALRALSPRAVAIDQPGHGRSGGEPLTTMDEAAAHLRAVARALFPGEAVVLAGHSLGAAQMLRAARRDPAAEVAGYVAIGAGARLSVGTAYADLARSDFDSLLSLLADRGTPPITIAQLKETGAAAVAADFTMACGHDLLLDAAKLTRPALVLVGGADTIAPPDKTVALAQALKGSKFVMYEGVGHLPMVERPKAVAAELRAFAAGL